jgi:pimeloyl-ACP methyl ester carboxylesterase
MSGQVRRPLDPSRPGGVQIDVHYVLVPALGRRKLPDPVFLLAGGPGQSAISLAPAALPLFWRLNNRRDIVFVDQRGTGRSAPLDCEDPRHERLADQADPERQRLRLVACREALGRLAWGDLRFFTTVLASQDLDAVRRQLGAERIDVVGASYGTRAGLDYLRQFPGAVRRLVLDGVAPPDMALPASFSRDGQAAFDALLTSCEADADCQRLHPRLRTEWQALLQSLPRRVSVVQPLTGQEESFVLTRGTLLGAVRAPLYSPLLVSALPNALHEAAQGRFQGLLTLGSGLSARKGTGIATGMHFSVVCAEDVPRLASAADAPGTDFGDDLARFYQRVCADWPRGEVPAAFYTLPPSPAPALLLSGGLDPATPPRHGERVAKALGPKARHAVVPMAGHGVLALGCMPDVLFRFIDAEDDAAALAVDTGCAAKIPRPPVFQPVAPPRGAGT